MAAKELARRAAWVWATITQQYLRHPFRILFSSLVVTLITAPIAAEYRFSTWPIELLLIVNLAVAAVGYEKQRGRYLRSPRITRRPKLSQ